VVLLACRGVSVCSPGAVLPVFRGGDAIGLVLAHGDKDVLRPVRCLNGINVKQVAAGGMHSLALTEDGQVRRGWAVGLVAKRHHVTVGLASVAWLHLRRRAGCALPGASKKIRCPATSPMPAPPIEHPQLLSCRPAPLPADLAVGRALGRFLHDHRPHAAPHRHRWRLCGHLLRSLPQPGAQLGGVRGRGGAGQRMWGAGWQV